MSLAGQGQGAEQVSPRIVDHEVPWGPTGARHGAAGLLQCQEKFVAQKRLTLAKTSRAEKRIPAGRIDLCDAVQKSRAATSHAWRTRGSTKGSASARSRYLSASSAAMQPVPAEVTPCR